MVTYCMLVVLTTLSAAQAVYSSDSHQRPRHLPPVMRRVVSRRDDERPARRRSAPVVLTSSLQSENTIRLNPATVRGAPTGERSGSPPYAWQAVAACLAYLGQRGVMQQAVALCAGEENHDECVQEISQWIQSGRVSVVEFSVLKVGYKKGFCPPSPACGPFSIMVPSPRILARLQRLSQVCEGTQQAATKALTSQDYMQACLALTYYHPSCISAFCEHLGIPQSSSHQLLARTRLPLWFQAAFALYLMGTPHHQKDQKHILLDSSNLRLLQPSSTAEEEAEKMNLGDVTQYLMELDALAPLQGGPFRISLQECSERMTYWVIMTHTAGSRTV